MNAHTRSRATAPRPLHCVKHRGPCGVRSSGRAPGLAAETPWQWLHATALVVVLAAPFLWPTTGSAQAVEASLPEVNVSASCLEVEVDGQRAPPSFECLTRKLSPHTAAQPQAHSPLASEAIIQRPSNQLGLFNRAATGHRMGNQFGISAFPQRPPEVQVSPRPIPVVPH